MATAQRRTDSGIEVRPVYTPADLEGWDPARRLGAPGSFPFTRGIYPNMYRGRPWTIRQYSGFGTAESTNERWHLLLAGGGTGLSCAFDLPTQMGYDSDHPRRRGRGRQGRGGHRLHRRHADPARRAPARSGHHLHDHQRHRRHPAAALPAGRRGAGGARGQAGRDDPKRHSQGVRGPGHLHLPAPPVDAADHRHLRLLPGEPAQLEHHLHLRLPHPRGRLDRCPGDRLHPRQRHRLRRGRGCGRHAGGRVRPPAQLLLERPQQLLRGGGQVSGRPPHVGPDHDGTLRRPGRQEQVAALPHPDRREHAHRPAAGEQHRPGHPAVAGRRARRHPEPARQRLRRGVGPADRQSGPDRAAHPADRRPRVGDHRYGRPAGGVVLRRVVDRRGRGRRLGLPGEDRRHGRGGVGDRGGLHAGGDRAGRLHLHQAGRQRREDHRRGQPVRGRRPGDDRGVSHRSRPAGPPDRPGAADPGRTGPAGSRRRPGRRGRRGAGDRQLAATDARGAPAAGDPRRGERRAAR